MFQNMERIIKQYMKRNMLSRVKGERIPDCTAKARLKLRYSRQKSIILGVTMDEHKIYTKGNLTNTLSTRKFWFLMGLDFLGKIWFCRE